MSDTFFGNVKESLKDKDSRYKAIFGIISGLCLGIAGGSKMVFDVLTKNGCAASASAADLITVGLGCLMLIGVIWVAGGMILYGVAWLPSKINEFFKNRSDPEWRKWRADCHQRMVAQYGTTGYRFKKWTGKNWGKVLVVSGIVVAAIGAAIGLAYGIAYMFWVLYC